jgi:phosphoglycolate phosphatase-like HAD superfamily hydrolase
MFRNIIWDVDGTLFDTYPAIARAFQAALHDFGKDAALDWVEELARISLSHCIAALAGHYHLEEDQLGEAFEQYYDQVTPQQQPPFPGVITICAYICGAGGKNVIVTHRGHAGTQELLAAHNMTHYFAGCLAREDGYPRKPYPAIFEAAIQIHDLSKAATLTVGDRGIDILAGKAAGLFTCLFGSDADEAMADLTITSFNDLYGFLTAESSSLPAVY